MARRKTIDPQVPGRIVRAAEQLFAARGYSGAAIRDIARAAGVNGAMIHYYFGSKEGLYHNIIETAAADIRAKLLNAVSSAESADERLSEFVHAYASYIFSHPDLARILHRELLAGGPHLKEMAPTFLTNYSIAREWMRQGVRRKELFPIDVDLAPISLIGMILIFQIAQPLISVVQGRERYDEKFVKRVADHTVSLFLDGARQRQPASPNATRGALSGKRRANRGSKKVTR
ncbi:MAG TPA: TetR family transcriptional regulator [Blastocatellia bacterium]|jgi:AcrR family transcriptional regulator|nr:TetR family transcriptional regulator [Blastocatellia bacterium]